MNNSITTTYRFELHFNATSFDGLKSRNLWWIVVVDDGGDGGLKGVFVSLVCQAKITKNTYSNGCKQIRGFEDTAITKAGIKLLLHRAHFSCSWDILGISTLKASAADT
ncbi:hypothetical protein Tco_0608501 [Tanacetum coccineum]